MTPPPRVIERSVRPVCVRAAERERAASRRIDFTPSPLELTSSWHLAS